MAVATETKRWTLAIMVRWARRVDTSGHAQSRTPASS